ncbi:FAD-binding oxidoreductase [Archangium lipolyticum]|uniref:FAD-binding oxidoreductase n=1 Tax=Archangium lipolyticum TaxID=2970465 RepID=UPI00214B36C4|nr:FAD-binding protein [Archangium lipolyticum]
MKTAMPEWISEENGPTSADPSANVTGQAQPVRGVVRPRHVLDVLRLVRRARAKGIPLYPFSTGLNHGYGSRSPVTPDNLLVDLSALQHIRVSTRSRDGAALPVVEIGPGVTQGMLYDFLERHHPEYTFNVTGAARATSIIGNALDRGVGYLGPRKEDLFGLVAVTGEGRLFRSGFRRLRRSPLSHSHPYGLGPMVDGLFFQGNFGLVVSACFRLVPKRPVRVALSLALHRAADLPQFLDELARCKSEGLIGSVTHIANQARTHVSMAYGITRYLETECGFSAEQAERETARALRVVAPGEWTSLGGIFGNAGQVKASVREVRARLGRIARVRVISDESLARDYTVCHAGRRLPLLRANAAAIAAVRPLHGLALGIPTDVAIDNLLWRFGRPQLGAAKLDASDCGLMFINPALPMDGALVTRVVAQLEAVAREYGHTLYITINIETPTSLVAVINLLFQRSDPAATARARQCADALLACLHRHGLELYRARADTMETLIKRDPRYWQTVGELKRVFDPDGIIAPGRYAPAQDWIEARAAGQAA